MGNALLLTEQDVRRVLPMPDLIAAMEGAMAQFSAGAVRQPVRSVIEVGDDRAFFGIMPAAMSDPPAVGAKLVTVFERNHERGLPSHLATIVLLDHETGALRAVLDGRYITEARTAAVSAVSVKHLARPDAAVLAVIGSGVQARSHVEALRHVRDLAEVRAWSPNAAHRDAFAGDVRDRLGLNARAAATAADAVRGADLIVLATSSKTPVIDDADVAAGAHIAAVGACRPDQREMPTLLIKRARVFVDSRAAARHEAGDLLIPLREGAIAELHLNHELGDAVAGRVPGRQHASQVTIFKSLGLAVEDMVAAHLAVDRATAANLGQAFFLVMKLIAAAIVALIAVAMPPPAQRYVASDSPALRELDAAFTAAYNLDFEEGLGLARHAVELDPGNSRVHRGLAAIIWMRVGFDRGAITVDHALGGISVPPLAFAANNPDLHEEFSGALAEAIRLAEHRLKKDPDDVAARYDAGAAYGLQASYMATIEGGYAGAFRYSRRAFDTQSEVLDRDPGFAAAGLITGNYRYSLASQASVVRFFAFFAGFSGGKEKAIALLEAASHDPLTRVDAKTALVQVYSREGRHTEAMRLTRELGIEVPRNRLMQLEEGAAAIRAGRDEEADAVLTRGLEAFEHDARQKLPGEHALWLYKRGLARLNLNRLADAVVDLRNALGARPLGWMAGRIHLALGNLADLDGRRSEAVSEYTRARDMCHASPDARCTDDARMWLRQPFTK